MKLIIVVEGGCVSSVLTDDHVSEFDVYLCDKRNERELDACKELKKQASIMRTIWP